MNPMACGKSLILALVLVASRCVHSYKKEIQIQNVDPDPDPDLVASASFGRIRIGIGIQGMPIRIRINTKQMKCLLFSRKFQYAVKNT
jgi:hypothetical protein